MIKITCNKCKESKGLGYFHNAKWKCNYGKYYICRECESNRRKYLRKTNKVGWMIRTALEAYNQSRTIEY